MSSLESQPLDRAALVRGFEDASLPAESFRHVDHVYVAWHYLRTEPPLRALERFSQALRRFAAAKGVPERYHETITWAYLLLIHERMARGASDDNWETFAARNPDLLVWRPSILERYYREGTLRSDLARRVFLLPDCGGQESEASLPVLTESE